MDFEIDPDTTAIAEAVLRFIEREVVPLEARHRDVLGSAAGCACALPNSVTTACSATRNSAAPAWARR
jgi:hypothetical protein